MSYLAILTHIYYEESYDEFKKYFLKESKTTSFFFNIGSNAKGENLLIQKIKSDFPQAYIITSPNIGKDIGGKLALIDLCLSLKIKVDYYILLHDKVSPHTTLGNIWREKLLSIIEPSGTGRIREMFERDRRLGIVAAKDFITNEYDRITDTFNSTNNLILKKLIKQYQLKNTDFDFIGGTMFWIRAEIINTFFSKNNPLDIRATLEKGNVLDDQSGTQTHSWERMLSWIALDQGFKIEGLS